MWTKASSFINLWPRDLNIDMDHIYWANILLNTNNLTLTFDNVTWKSIGNDYCLSADNCTRFGNFQAKQPTNINEKIMLNIITLHNRRSLLCYLKGEGVKEKKNKEKSYKISLITFNNQTKTFFYFNIFKLTNACMYDYNEHIFY